MMTLPEHRLTGIPSKVEGEENRQAHRKDATEFAEAGYICKKIKTFAMNKSV